MTRDEALGRISDFLFRNYESDNPNVIDVLAAGMDLEVDTWHEDDPEIILRYTLLRKNGGPARTSIQIYSLEDILEMICDDD